MHLLLLLGVIFVFTIGRTQGGDKCEVCYLKDCCEDPISSGGRNIKTSEGKIFGAYCEQGWTYIFRRFNGVEDFYRTWVEYQHGFGDPRWREYFIGLDNLASFVKGRKCKVRIDLEAWPPVSPAKRFAEYSVFSIADKTDKYRLAIGEYSGTAGDAMSHHNRQQFSTYDEDNDIDSRRNCASVYKGAWWYKGCHNSNLFGWYYKGPDCPKYAQCVAWYRWPTVIGSPDNFYYSFKKASMKIHCC
ncbi:unnamed protein product [Owenia fusiformis]|uniref:Fibrinogen C-terminal domain-containing protein n=1 Tax=Owenia fusiformis TaxID=6347 RepID=A0A8S4PW92_OWEFU|nr:unnamed protein product [Owenia fusiformis]